MSPSKTLTSERAKQTPRSAGDGSCGDGRIEKLGWQQWLPRRDRTHSGLLTRLFLRHGLDSSFAILAAFHFCTYSEPTCPSLPLIL